MFRGVEEAGGTIVTKRANHALAQGAARGDQAARVSSLSENACHRSKWDCSICTVSSMKRLEVFIPNGSRIPWPGARNV
jgi:hypothetical protein